MNLFGIDYLLYFYNNIDILLIILIRILAFILILPIFSISSIPVITKIAFSIFLALIVFISGRVDDVYYFNSFMGFAVLIVQEFFVGFTMAFTVYAVFSILHFAMQLVDFQIGFSMISVFDPVSQIQIPITGNLVYYIITVFFIITGGINYFITGIFYSYEVIPVGLGIINNNANLINVLNDMMVNYFILGLQIALPIVGSIFIVDIVLGVLVKAVPQMNVFVVGLPIKILVGLIILYVISPIFILVYDNIFEHANRAFTNSIRSMSP